MHLVYVVENEHIKNRHIFASYSLDDWHMFLVISILGWQPVAPFTNMD